jgi:exosome complex component RRP40
MLILMPFLCFEWPGLIKVSCVDGDLKARGLGVIPTSGLIITVSLDYARRMLSSDDQFLSELGREIRFETTIGMNGRIW